jgi:hypothetical protein
MIVVIVVAVILIIIEIGLVVFAFGIRRHATSRSSSKVVLHILLLETWDITSRSIRVDSLFNRINITIRVSITNLNIILWFITLNHCLSVTCISHSQLRCPSRRMRRIHSHSVNLLES